MRMFAGLVGSLLLVTPAAAQDKADQCAMRKQSGVAERVALVVGNNTLRNNSSDRPALVNGVNDARLIASLLEGLGFAVRRLEQIDSSLFRRELDQFRVRVAQLCSHDIVAFYYAGNGFELGRTSYIATTDVAYPLNLETELETLQPWVRIGEILESLRDHAGPKLVIIDTCRNYQLPDSQAAKMPEFAGTLQIPRNTLIAYAAEPGQTASDGPPGSRNGPYAIAIANALRKPNSTVEDAFRTVRDEVDKATNGQQKPFMESGLRDAIYLSGKLHSAGHGTIRGKRIALVIGNSKYANAPVLENPANDAKDVANVLRRIGFEVKEVFDASRQKMSDALTEFDESMDSGDPPEWAIVYFAGHGIARDESPYMVPVDARLKSHTVIDQQTVKALPVFSMVAKATRLGIVILDACRENPFLMQVAEGAKKRNISMGHGLPPVEPREENVLVAYSTKHGQLAYDGTGRRNSPFVEALLESIEQPGVDIDMVFRKVRDGVRRRTSNSQHPFTYASLPGIPIYLVPPR